MLRTVRTAALLLPLLLPSCGLNLLQVRREFDVRTPEGQGVHAVVWLQCRWGLAMGFGGGGTHGNASWGILIFWVFIEVADTVGSTGAAAVALVDGDLAVPLGPGGWILSLLPLITLLPDPLPDMPPVVMVEVDQLARLQVPDPAVAHAEMERIVENALDARGIDYGLVEYTLRELR